MLQENFQMLAKCFKGFEPELAKELLQIGAREIRPGRRSVSFVGDLGFLYKANLSLRTALRILVPIANFNANGLDELYLRCLRIKWESYFGIDKSIAIDPTVFSKSFSHSLVVAQKTKDAIADRFREKYNRRPDVNLDDPDIRINVHIEQNQVTLSLDSSGASLHKRGYKTATNIAPINEVLAAGIVLKSGWGGQCDFFDPMCGSGTILIEAAMIASNKGPNINRKDFAFKNWKNFDSGLLQVIQQSVIKKEKPLNKRIYGLDRAASAVVKAKANIRNAGLEQYIEVNDGDFFRSHKQGSGPLHILFNPPYGERLKIDIPVFYSRIGNTLKRNYPGTKAWFITSNVEGLKSVGLKPKSKFPLKNGALDAKLVEYELYEGSRKGRS